MLLGRWRAESEAAMPLFRQRTPLSMLVDEYCEIMRRRSHGTPKAWRTDQNRLRAATQLLKARYVQGVTPSAVADVMNTKEAEGRSAKCVNA